MANQLDAAELVKQQSVRAFYQPGGPAQQRYFYGQDTSYFFIDGAQKPTNGKIDPIYVSDPRNPGQYKLVGRKISAPDLPTVKVNFMEEWGGIPRVLMSPLCEANFYEVHSRCADFSDFYRGWESAMIIYSGFKLTGNIDMGTRMSMDADDPLKDSITATGVSIYPVGVMNFGQEASAQVVVEVIDAVYGTSVQCANCGTANDGSQFIYTVTRANVGSPSAPGQLVYTLNGGTTWDTATITGIGSTNQPTLIDIAGNILFVCAGTSLFYTVLNEITGAPTTWNTVTMPATMTDVYVQSPNAIYFVNTTSAQIWKTTDITIAPTSVNPNPPANLHRIAGAGNVIVATGASGTVVYSLNDGVTWITATAPAVAIIHSVAVIDSYYWIVGSNAGVVYKSIDRGASWATLATPLSGTGSVVDIVAATREVIWIAQNVNNVAYLLTSLDGGQSWTYNAAGTSRIANWPVFQQIDRIACPVYATPDIAANNITIGGLATGGATGILLAASPTFV